MVQLRFFDPKHPIEIIKANKKRMEMLDINRAKQILSNKQALTIQHSTKANVRRKVLLKKRKALKRIASSKLHKKLTLQRLPLPLIKAKNKFQLDTTNHPEATVYQGISRVGFFRRDKMQAYLEAKILLPRLMENEGHH